MLIIYPVIALFISHVLIEIGMMNPLAASADMIAIKIGGAAAIMLLACKMAEYLCEDEIKESEDNHEDQ